MEVYITVMHNLRTSYFARRRGYIHSFNGLLNDVVVFIAHIVDNKAFFTAQIWDGKVMLSLR